MDRSVLERLTKQFEAHFRVAPEAVAYAPGRVEILGNHTDYNEGYVLSAAINFGTFCAAARAPDRRCRVVAGDLMQEAAFPLERPDPDTRTPWANYVKGMLAGLAARGALPGGFLGMFLGNVPLGAGLSSSAALEMSSGLALAALYGCDVPPLEMAKIGQVAEHQYAGLKCGLLDQITSLFGRPGELVRTDFRTLATRTIRMGDDLCFLVCNTRAKHRLVDSAYNERRERCEEAAAYFAKALSHPVHTLRDVGMAEWTVHAGRMDPVAARRAAHVIGECERVQRGEECLARGDVAGFGALMFESHDSSRLNFENSCVELDFLVDAARRTAGVLGARLSGGGFGGSAVMLLHPADATRAGELIRAAYDRQFGHPCDVLVIEAAGGARTIHRPS